MVCHLKKSLYGLKQSPKCWNNALDSQLESMGFVQSVDDPCIYTSTSDKLEKPADQLKSDLGHRFQLKNMCKLKCYFLGVSVKQNSETVTTWIIQPANTEAVLQKFGMEHSKPANTPVAEGTKLVKATEESESIDASQYQSAVGSLLYLSGWTKPDIAFAVSNVARFFLSSDQRTLDCPQVYF